MNIDGFVEMQRDFLEAEMYSTREKQFECPCCWVTLGENDPSWEMPHPCGIHMEYHEAYTCGSNECNRKWVDRHWESMVEYEHEQMQEIS